MGITVEQKKTLHYMMKYVTKALSEILKDYRNKNKDLTHEELCNKVQEIPEYKDLVALYTSLELADNMANVIENEVSITYVDKFKESLDLKLFVEENIDGLVSLAIKKT